MSESNEPDRAGSPAISAAASDAWLNRSEAAAYLRISVMALAKMAMANSGPSFYRPSRRVVYRKTDLDKWMIGRRRRCAGVDGETQAACA
jgi:hypothetical protein